VSYPSFLEVLSFIRVTVRAPSAFFAASVEIHPKILTNKETERVPLSENAGFARVDATLLENQTALRLIGRISDIFGPERTLCNVQWVPISDSIEFKTSFVTACDADTTVSNERCRQMFVAVAISLLSEPVCNQNFL
jgi:hypothetical protein